MKMDYILSTNQTFLWKFEMSYCALTHPCSRWPKRDLFPLLAKSPPMITNSIKWHEGIMVFFFYCFTKSSLRLFLLKHKTKLRWWHRYSNKVTFRLMLNLFLKGFKISTDQDVISFTHIMYTKKVCSYQSKLTLLTILTIICYESICSYRPVIKPAFTRLTSIDCKTGVKGTKRGWHHWLLKTGCHRNLLSHCLSEATFWLISSDNTSTGSVAATLWKILLF